MPGPWYSYANITGDTTTVVKSSPGVLRRLVINAPTATEVITLWDNPSSAAGAKIGTITIPTSPQPVTLFYDAYFTLGLTIQTATATSDLTAVFE